MVYMANARCVRTKQTGFIFNLRLSLIMLDKQELYHKIKEMLIISQFEYWVEGECKEPTADWVSSRPQRAVDCYLGRSKNFNIFEMNKFHRLVNLQIALIMREIEDVGFLEYCKERDDGYTNP